MIDYSTDNNSYTEATRMWANAQPDGRPAEHRWRPLFNAAKFGWRPLLDAVEICRGAQTGQPISAVSGPKFAILWGHVEEVLMLNKIFSDCRYMP